MEILYYLGKIYWKDTRVHFNVKSLNLFLRGGERVRDRRRFNVIYFSSLSCLFLRLFKQNMSFYILTYKLMPLLNWNLHDHKSVFFSCLFKSIVTSVFYHRFGLISWLCHEIFLFVGEEQLILHNGSALWGRKLEVVGLKKCF